MLNLYTKQNFSKFNVDWKTVEPSVSWRFSVVKNVIDFSLNYANLQNGLTYIIYDYSSPLNFFRFLLV